MEYETVLRGFCKGVLTAQEQILLVVVNLRGIRCAALTNSWTSPYPSGSAPVGKGDYNADEPCPTVPQQTKKVKCQRNIVANEDEESV